MISHPSPNFNERNAPISMIVLHYTAMPTCEAALKRLCMTEHPSGRVSAHYLVDVDGTSYQLVDESKRAWHAGIGSWGDVRDVNSAAIGIEIQNLGLEEDGRRVPFPDAQIEAVIALCRDIQQRHGIHPWNIVGHSDVSPTRKQDPGEAFPWRRLAEAGVGLWTDGFASPKLPDEKMLASIGYDVSDPDKALMAFKRHWHPEAIAEGAGNTSGRIAAIFGMIAKGKKSMKAREKKQESVRLTTSQSAWLKMIVPETPHAKYMELRKEKDPSAKDILFDNGNFGRFLRGKLACRRELAETVFEAFDMSPKQMEIVKNLTFLADADSASDATTKFFKGCGRLLWHHGADKGAADADTEPILLELVSCVLEHRVANLTYSQKFIVFGELLDYLNETRQYKIWPVWMIALSRHPNRDLFKKIRSKSSDNGFFPGAKKDTKGRVRHDMDVIANLTKNELDDCAFFVRRVNMRINEIRFENFKKQQDEFDAISDNLLSDPDNPLFSTLRELEERGKSFARNYFAWAKENVKPYLEAVRKTSNPHRWYFLMCATRLMYDWARWHYYSVLDEDKRNACDMYRDIRDLADECALYVNALFAKKQKSGEKLSEEEKALPVIKCRFYYMAATACRYMAECSSEGVWHGDEGAADYASAAVEYARMAVREFEKSSEIISDGGGKKALDYRFKRNCARILTFAARWWLLHPNEYGGQPHMKGCDSDYPEDHGITLLSEAGGHYTESVFTPIGADDCSGKGPMVLNGKRQLEYEFHLRVWLEMLAHYCKTYMGPAGEEEAAEVAMPMFCRMLLIYDHLFKEGNTGSAPCQRSTSLAPETAEAARKWLRCHDLYSGAENMFDVSQLDKTLQGAHPSLEETRFEILCAFRFSTSAMQRAADSALWKQLEYMEGEAGKSSSEERDEFVKRIWLPAKAALQADLDESLGMMREKTKRFLKENKTAEDRNRNWKGYPPFKYRNNLLAAPGNNSKHVECIMHRFKMEWDRVKKEMAPSNPCDLRVDFKALHRQRGAEMKKGFRNMSKEEREQLLTMVFGPWKERAELNDILFPDSKNGKSRFSSMWELLNHGKSAGVIEAALEILLSQDPMAGEPNMDAFGKDQARKDEFATDISVFADNAFKYLKSRSELLASQTITSAAKAIVKLAQDVKKGKKGQEDAQAAMGALWYGIAALLESMENIKFSLVRDLCKPLHIAASASSKLCGAEIKAFHAAVGKHSAVLWQHAVHGPVEARDSFSIFSELTGKRPDAKLVADFCRSFNSDKSSNARGKSTPLQPKRRRRISK